MWRRRTAQNEEAGRCASEVQVLAAGLDGSGLALYHACEPVPIGPWSRAISGLATIELINGQRVMVGNGDEAAGGRDVRMVVSRTSQLPGRVVEAEARCSRS